MSVGHFLAPRDVQADWGFVVRDKPEFGQDLRRALRKGELDNKTIYCSGVTDCYATRPDVTKDMWQAFLETPVERRPRRIVIQTRIRPDRDTGLMQEYVNSCLPSDNGPPVLVSYSIGTDHNDHIRMWERATPSFQSRLQAIENLSAAGLFVVATLSPFGLWHDLAGALRRFQAYGVQYLTVLFFKEKTGATTTPKPFLEYLRQDYPQLLDPDWQTEQVRLMKSIYGDQRVLVGKPGFSSLAQPQAIVPNWNSSNRKRG